MTRRDVLALTPALLMTACSSDEAPKKKEEEKPAEPVTGLHALYQLFIMARAWAPDLVILRYTSIDFPEVKHQDGKAAAWQVVFGSPAMSLSRTYTFSVYEASATLHKGLFPEGPQAWSGGGLDGMKPFTIDGAKVDTDKAWEVAVAHAEDYNKKNSKLPITYALASDKGNDPVWRVIWGSSAGESSFSVLVNASTGEFMRIVH